MGVQPLRLTASKDKDQFVLPSEKNCKQGKSP